MRELRKAARKGALLNQTPRWAVGAQAWEEVLVDGVEQGFSHFVLRLTWRSDYKVEADSHLE